MARLQSDTSDNRCVSQASQPYPVQAGEGAAGAGADRGELCGRYTTDYHGIQGQVTTACHNGHIGHIALIGQIAWCKIFIETKGRYKKDDWDLDLDTAAKGLYNTNFLAIMLKYLHIYNPG